MNVLDASAVLAWLRAEPGRDTVDAALDGGLISSINWAEVLQKASDYGSDADHVATRLLALGVHVVALDTWDAHQIAALYPQTRALGVGIADRACLALARRRSCPALTTDRTWGDLDVGVTVTVLR